MCGLNGTAYVDTGATRSIVGYLCNRVKDICEFEKENMKIKLADGSSQTKEVLTDLVDVEICDGNNPVPFIDQI